MKWDPAKHPRGPVGRFITANGGSRTRGIDREYESESLTGWHTPSLSDEEEAALVDYTEASWVNASLRTGDSAFDLVPDGFEDRDSYVDALDRAIDQGELEDDTKVYRSIGMGGLGFQDYAAFKAIRPGDQIHDRGYLSTSATSGATNLFGEFRMEIDLPAGTRAALPGMYTDWARPQAEILLGRGTVLEIDSIEWSSPDAGRIRARLIGYLDD